MLQAFLHGKLSREQENMEDLLTASVFGALQYADPAQGLVPVLGRARSGEGERLLREALRDGVSEACYSFWPWIEEVPGKGCEPDVLIRVTGCHGTKYLLLVEAKLHSGKSSREEENGQCDPRHEDRPEEKVKDQLGKEWVNLAKLAEKEHRRPVLVYVTGHLTVPRSDLEESMRSLGAANEACLCWASWRDLEAVLKANPVPILADAAKLLRRLCMVFFEGVRLAPPEEGGPIGWSFVRAQGTLKWVLPKDAGFRWRYASAGKSRFNWHVARETGVAWRFAT